MRSALERKLKIQQALRSPHGSIRLIWMEISLEWWAFFDEVPASEFARLAGLPGVRAFPQVKGAGTTIEIALEDLARQVAE